MKDKVYLYCDLNNISKPERFARFATYIAEHNFDSCIAYNVERFLIDGIRNLTHNSIDDEAFFLIGDSTSETIVKIPLPHLHAGNEIIEVCKANTLYVIDTMSFQAYVHSYDRDALLKQLKSINSDIYVL